MATKHGLTYKPVLMCPPMQMNSCIDELSCTGAAQVGGGFGPKAVTRQSCSNVRYAAGADVYKELFMLASHAIPVIRKKLETYR